MKSLLEKIKENVDNGNLENESLKNKEFEYFDEKNKIKDKIQEISESKAVLLKASPQ